MNAAMIVARKSLLALIVAERQSAIVFGVACDGGRPGPHFRSSAVRLR